MIYYCIDNLQFILIYSENLYPNCHDNRIFMLLLWNRLLIGILTAVKKLLRDRRRINSKWMASLKVEISLVGKARADWDLSLGLLAPLSLYQRYEKFLKQRNNRFQIYDSFKASLASWLRSYLRFLDDEQAHLLLLRAFPIIWAISTNLFSLTDTQSSYKLLCKLHND